MKRTIDEGRLLKKYQKLSTRQKQHIHQVCEFLIRENEWHGYKGPKAFRRKLTDRQVRESRALYATGDYTYQQLADKCGVSKVAMIQCIKRNTHRGVE